MRTQAEPFDHEYFRHFRGDIGMLEAECLRSIEQIADHPHARLRLAQLDYDRGEIVRAREHLIIAVNGARRQRLREEGTEIYVLFSLLERTAGDLKTALAAARAGLSQCGENARLIWQECEALRLLGNTLQRVHRLNRLAALNPADRDVLVELGLALLSTSSAPQALRPLRQAIELGVDDPEVVLALARLEIRADNFDAASTLLHALEVKQPENLGVIAALWESYKLQCRWDESERFERSMVEHIEAGSVHPWLAPFVLLCADISPQTLRDYAERLAKAHRQPLSPLASPTPPRTSTEKLRVGYLSADFHHHATAMLIAGLFEHHDGGRIDVFAYSYGPRVDDEYRQRLKNAIPQWRDLNELSDREAAQQIANDHIDVLVEMKGHTLGARPDIAAHRPAPLIAHYLGYPGTLCADGVHYQIADEIVVPVEDESLYVEKILRMPNCYQVNDSARARPIERSRNALGLPEDAVVLCNFNHALKWNALYFDLWLHAVAQVPNACLWLLDPGQAARQALSVRAEAAGVAARLYWAPKLPLAEHLERLASADLALDQLPCASHTTASDALWMGVPVLTCLGEAFHGRVAASLLNAVRLPTFITNNIADYDRRLAELLRDPGQLRAAKLHLRSPDGNFDLFNTAQFTRNWERLLETEFRRHTM